MRERRVEKVDFFVGFIGDEQFHAQECYVLCPNSERFEYFMST
jgi:hypothetical protein